MLWRKLQCAQDSEETKTCPALTEYQGSWRQIQLGLAPFSFRPSNNEGLPFPFPFSLSLYCSLSCFLYHLGCVDHHYIHCAAVLRISSAEKTVLLYFPCHPFPFVHLLVKQPGNRQNFKYIRHAFAFEAGNKICLTHRNSDLKTVSRLPSCKQNLTFKNNFNCCRLPLRA